MSPTYADLFSGGGGATAGAVAAGFTPIWAVENDDHVADVYEQNFGPHIHRRGVQDVDFSELESPEWLHMSPVCTRASVANRARGESDLDVVMGDACSRAVRDLLPPVVSLENVWGYRKFQSFETIVNTLRFCGYETAFWQLNAADFGVPQTRKRLVLVARRDGVSPVMPVQTHARGGEGGKSPWSGWYAAVEDLLDRLPESRFAAWQLRRLPERYRAAVEDSFLVGEGSHSPATGICPGNADAPPTIVASVFKQPFRAFLVHGTSTMEVRDCGDPAAVVVATVGAKAAVPRALLVQGRVVQMTPRALARFQSFGDDFILPQHRALAFKVIGNAVPPLLQRRVMEAQRYATCSVREAA